TDRIHFALKTTPFFSKRTNFQSQNPLRYLLDPNANDDDAFSYILLSSIL
ncbi:unnamed protein product, partial [Brassica rapa subsp. trilocularis]